VTVDDLARALNLSAPAVMWAAARMGVSVRNRLSPVSDVDAELIRALVHMTRTRRPEIRGLWRDE
jgi:hypothetical protein